MPNNATVPCVHLPGRPTAGPPGCLVLIHPAGPAVGTRYPLGDDPVEIGRQDDCAVRNEDGSVSRRHARIARSVCGGHVVLDLGSTNGTFVNNQRRQLATLADGDQLRAGVCVYRYFAGAEIEASCREEMRRLAHTDALTEVANRRSLVTFLDTNPAPPVSLVMFDLDLFRAVNDRLGFLAGDLLLRELADVVRPWVRSGDVFARSAGDEFVLVLPGTPPDAAVAAAERVRQAIADHPFRFEATPAPLTVSAGVASSAGAPAGLLEAAEERVARAKRDGRNRVVG